jgi:Tfp pilus assembly protein PilE
MKRFDYKAGGRMGKANREKRAVRGFTLLEVIVIVIIIGILSIIGFTQFVKMIEQSRTAEAKMILGQLRQAQRAYYLSYSTYTTSMDLGVDTPTACVETHYFSYSIPFATDSDFTLAATRCTSSDGKFPTASSAYDITLNSDGGWSGTEGYY